MKEVLVSYKVLLNNQIKDAKISVPMAETVANNLISTGQSGIAVNQVERMLTALENLKGRTYIPGTATFSKPEDKKAEPVAAPKPEPERRWLNVDLELVQSILFRQWLMNEGIKFETSGNGELTHFEVFCSEKEVAVANNELDRICSIVSIF